jgi:hypothetical protein
VINAIKELEAKALAAKEASHRMAYLSTEIKNKMKYWLQIILIIRKLLPPV